MVLYKSNKIVEDHCSLEPLLLGSAVTRHDRALSADDPPRLSSSMCNVYRTLPVSSTSYSYPSSIAYRVKTKMDGTGQQRRRTALSVHVDI